MAKGFKPTGRRKFFKKRFGSKARANIRTSNIVAIPRAMSYPIAAQTRFTLRATYIEQLNFAIGANQGYLYYEAYLPAIAAGNRAAQNDWIFPYGFLPLMQLYGRCVVEKSKFSTRIESLNNDANSPAEVLSAITSQSRVINMAAGDDENYLAIKDLPTTTSKLMGTRDSGHDSTYITASVDVSKFIGQPLTLSNSIVRNVQAGFDVNIEYPTPAQNQQSPVHLIFIRRANNLTAASYRLHYSFEYQCLFSEVVPMPTRIVTQTNVQWTWAPEA